MVVAVVVIVIIGVTKILRRFGHCRARQGKGHYGGQQQIDRPGKGSPGKPVAWCRHLIPFPHAHPARAMIRDEGRIRTACRSDNTPTSHPAG